jgi:hypothetical protein
MLRETDCPESGLAGLVVEVFANWQSLCELCGCVRTKMSISALYTFKVVA